MAKRMVMAAAVLTLFLGMGFGSLSYAAQPNVAPDPQFEKVAKELYPKAKQEGEVILYSVYDVQHLVALLDAFSKQFPGIKTSYWQNDNPAMLTRVLTEYNAGAAGADLLVCASIMTTLRAAGTITPYETVQKDSLVIHDPTMPVVSMQIQTMGFNTKKIKAEDVPKKWEDIATAKYKGIVALDDPMRGGPLTTQLAILKYSWKDDAKFTNYVKGLKALNVPLHRSSAAMFRLVISGEYSIAEPANFIDIINEKAKGAPVDFVKSVPPILFPHYAGIYAKSPHPNAAKLLAEWLISPAGQATLDSVGREVSRKGFPSKTSIDAAWPGLKPLTEYDKEFADNPRKWLDANVKPIWEGK